MKTLTFQDFKNDTVWGFLSSLTTGEEKEDKERNRLIQKEGKEKTKQEAMADSWIRSVVEAIHARPTQCVLYLAGGASQVHSLSLSLRTSHAPPHIHIYIYMNNLIDSLIEMSD